jgi:hypothetical protein
MKNMDNAATTAATEAMKVAEKSIEECRLVAARAEDNYRAWYRFMPFLLLILREQCNCYVLWCEILENVTIYVMKLACAQAPVCAHTNTLYSIVIF